MKEYLLLLFISITSQLFGQSSFQKTYSLDGLDGGRSFAPTADGGFCATGYCLRIGDSHDQIYFLRADSNSNIISSGSYGSHFEHREGICIQQCYEGNFIIAGYSADFSIAGNYAFLMRTDEIGQVAWFKTFGDLHDNFGASVRQTADSGFILVGSTLNYTTMTYNLFVVRTDKNGDSLWTKQFYSGSNSYGNSIQQTFDGGFIISVGINNNASLVKLSATGNLLWVKSFAGNLDGYSTAVQQITDSGFIMTGYIEDSATYFYKIFLIRTDSVGDTLWTKKYGGDKQDVAASVSQTSDMGFILAGFTTSFGVMDTDVYVIKTQSNGDTIWTKTYGDSLEETAGSVFQTFDGGYIVGGYSQSYGGSKVYVIKTDTAGISGCNERKVPTIVSSQHFTILVPPLISYAGSTEGGLFFSLIPGGVENNLCSSVDISENENQQKLISIFPNPFENEIFLSTPSHKSLSEISILDLTGKEILQQDVVQAESVINTASISPGIYLLRYFDGNTFVHYKIIKQ